MKMKNAVVFFVLCVCLVTVVAGNRTKRSGWLQNLFDSMMGSGKSDTTKLTGSKTTNSSELELHGTEDMNITATSNATSSSKAVNDNGTKRLTMHSGNSSEGKELKGTQDLNLTSSISSTSGSTQSTHMTTTSKATPTTHTTISTIHSTTTPTRHATTPSRHTTTTPRQNSTTIHSSKMKLNPECRKPNDLKTYCSMSGKFQQYMAYDTTAESLIKKLFSTSVLTHLINSCKPGDWCLSDEYIVQFGASMSSVFMSPLCTSVQGLLGCLDELVYKRMGCPGRTKMVVFEDALSLVCNMNKVKVMTPTCFGHTLATLHVTMADIIRQAAHKRLTGKEFCLGEYVGMERKFMCTLDKCPYHQKLFEQFRPWKWFMEQAPAIKEICKLKSVCGDKELKAEKSATHTTSPHGSQARTMKPEPNNAGPEPFFILHTTDETTRLLIWVTTGTAVALLGLMVLVCAVYQRMHRRGRPLLAKDGYAKIPNEDEIN